METKKKVQERQDGWAVRGGVPLEVWASRFITGCSNSTLKVQHRSSRILADQPRMLKISVSKQMVV